MIRFLSLRSPNMEMDCCLAKKLVNISNQFWAKSR
jgi:hypothetical protein